jgi:hypothetical protein
LIFTTQSVSAILLSSDLSIFEIPGCLSHGGKILPLDDSQMCNPDYAFRTENMLKTIENDKEY